MKKYLFLAIAVITCFSANAQSLSGWGHAPTLSRSYTENKSTPYAVVANGFDTLVSSGTSDTGFAAFNLPNRYTSVVDLFVARLTGTLAGTAILQGSNSSTQPAPNSTTWQTITGSIVYCAGCVGASATLTGTGTTQYTWHLPPDALDYQYYQVKVVATGTNTETYTLRVTTKI